MLHEGLDNPKAFRPFAGASFPRPIDSGRIRSIKRFLRLLGGNFLIHLVDHLINRLPVLFIQHLQRIMP